MVDCKVTFYFNNGMDAVSHTNKKEILDLLDQDVPRLLFQSDGSQPDMVVFMKNVTCIKLEELDADS